MGQTPSVSFSASAADGDVSQVQTRLQARLNILKSLAKVTHKEVLACIVELNSVTRSFTDRSGKQLRFVVRKGTDTTFLWKATIRIACIKLITSANTVESSRLLTLRQFVMIYREITDQVTALSGPIPGLDRQEELPEGQSSPTGQDTPSCKIDEFTASAFFPPQSQSDKSKDGGAKADKSKQSEYKGLSEGLSECCVCMDSKACIMLSCCHEFCETCIDNWTRDENHRNCPLCRTKVDGSDDTWVLTDEQDPKDYEHEVRGYLLGLADRSGRPAEPYLESEQLQEEYQQNTASGGAAGAGSYMEDITSSDSSSSER
ncbi:RING finger protein 141 [Elysia marginata]|uniref:RING finger protein 141 n=1 Tax=Elysia marginata TaxID=1093978 RepID=A0AAV4EGJ7_9GAST|nr:RING finger protein 141 [Elysia marginata]